ILGGSCKIKLSQRAALARIGKGAIRMVLRKSRLVTGVLVAALVTTLTGCGQGNTTPEVPKTQETQQEASVQPEEKKFDLEWTVQPTLGTIKGDYHRIEERFRQGHLGTLEVVKNDGEIVHVEFNETT